ncbi:MAG: ATP-binding cassette domain-containing protein [Micrococcaceae bacterium]|uniref:ATP-binding cassette domain-containing protein n=1 Tax=Arthrobacter rhombi TaxID=71253 RepID=UPI00264B596E|nr:ATP-binding cassette domain-containing protein [Micrococcaceae bacterium]
MSTPVLEAIGLRKSFGNVSALDGLDLTVPAGQVMAVLGPNGAGKSTFIRSVATLVRPDEGTLLVDGIDVLQNPGRVRGNIGLAGQYAAVEHAMTGRENLQMIARLFGHSNRASHVTANAVIEQLGLAEVADRLVRTYSGGMRRRVDLAASLTGAPRLLLLDEPTTGLDPRSRIELWDTIRDLVARGTDVVLTTQYLDEADRLADQIVIIDHGRAIASGSPDQLKSRAGRSVIEVRVHSHHDLNLAAQALQRLGAAPPVVDSAARKVSITVDAGPAQLAVVVSMLNDQRVATSDIALRRPTLDEVFLSLTGHDSTSDTEFPGASQ